MSDDDCRDTRRGAGRGSRAIRAACNFVLLAALVAVTVVAHLVPALAIEPIVVDPRNDRIEITGNGELYNNRGDSLRVQTVAGPDGVVGRMDVKASTPGTNPNWIVFALTNRTDRHIERWLTAERYTSVGSGGVWPDLDASRIATVTPSIGFVPERVKSDRADVFRITLEPGQTITFVAELSSERFARIFLWKPLAYELKVRERQLFNGTLLGLTGLMAIFLTAIFAANHKAIFPTAALVAWCVLVYLCVDFGFFHKLFNLRPEDNAVYRAAGEASIAASLVIFLYTFLRLGLSHGLVRMLFAVWMLAQLALIAVAVVDPRLAATFARLSFLVVGAAGAAIVLFLAFRGQDRAMSLIPTWLLFLVWIFATAVTLTGRISGDIVVAGLAAGLVLVVVLIGFTVTQFAFRSLEPAYASAPDEQQIRSLAVDGVGAATWEWSARRDEIKVSPILEAQLGLNMGELSTKVDDFLQHVHSGDRDRFRQVLWSVQERAGGRIRVEFRLRHSDSSYRWYELEAASVQNAERRNVRCVGLLRDVTDPKRTHERLLQDAVRCRVTGLPHREIFLDRLAVASLRAKHDDKTRPTIIFIDLDRFRSVNATLGIAVGDSLLLTIARRLKRHVGEADTLARIAGDQFAILLAEAQDPRELASLAERIRRSLRSPIKIAGQEIVVTGSLGIAVYEGDKDTPEDLLKGAEIAMYRAKRQGADRIEIFNPDMRSEAVGGAISELELRKALDAGQIAVYYQPIVYLPTEELAGFEAFLRWEHPKHKSLPHSTLIEVAEKSDLIKRVGGHLLTTAMEAVGGWQRLLPRTEAPLFVSVSISNAQIYKPEIVEEWRQILGRHIVSTESIRLQVSEALAMENPERAVEMMRVLAAAGSELVLDGFGSAYTSVSYLQRFSADTIKVDRMIVQAGTAGDGEGGALVRSVAALAHELGKRVLADGVEIEDDVVFLRAIGCEYGQGLYYGEPMPEREVVDLVKLIAKSERKLEAPGLFRTRPKKTKRVKRDGEVADAGVAAAAAGMAAGMADQAAYANGRVDVPANGAAQGHGHGQAQDQGHHPAGRAMPNGQHGMPMGERPPGPSEPAGNGNGDGRRMSPPSTPAGGPRPNGPAQPANAPMNSPPANGHMRGAPQTGAQPPSLPSGPSRGPGGGSPFDNMPPGKDRLPADEVFKDARRALAGLPNLTVRPLDRPPNSDHEPDTGRPGDRKAPPVAARGESTVAQARPPEPPPTAGAAPQKRPVGAQSATSNARAAAVSAPSPKPPEQPPAAVSPRHSDAGKGAVPPPLAKDAARSGMLPPVEPPQLSGGGGPAARASQSPPAQRPSPAPVQTVATHAAKPVTTSGAAPATPAEGSAAAGPQPPPIQARSPTPPRPPQPPAAAKQATAERGPSLSDQLFGKVADAGGPASPADGLGSAVKRLSELPGGEPSAAATPPAGRGEGRAAPANAPPPVAQRPAAAAEDDPRTLPPTQSRRPEQPRPGSRPRPPASGPRPAADSGDPYGHLPPGIAASLARLAGKGGGAGAAAAKGGDGKRSPEPVGGGARLVKRDKPKD